MSTYKFSYTQLTRATDIWKKQNIIGQGGFSIVYKGNWNGTEIAVKKMKKGVLNHEKADFSIIRYNELKHIYREVSLLGSLSHKNIIQLFGFNKDGESPCLVYALMINGSLQDRLLLKKPVEPLNWSQRHKIALGIARGLEYLHTVRKTPIIHGDIKSANILLDDKLEAKISDFGMAKESPRDTGFRVNKPRGTQVYMPNEYIYGNHLSIKVDCYAYGIVLFELATGLPAYDSSRAVNQHLRDLIWSQYDDDLISLKDAQAGDEDYEIFDKLISFGIACSNRIETLRPNMTCVCRLFDNNDFEENSPKKISKTINKRALNKPHFFAKISQVEF